MATRTIYAVIILTKPGLSKQDKHEMYCARICPIMEYACQVWHPGFTMEESGSHEYTQKQVLKIVYKNPNFEDALAHLSKLRVHSETMCKELFEQIKQENHSLNKLLLPKNENTIGLIKINMYEAIRCKTIHYKDSIIPYIS